MQALQRYYRAIWAVDCEFTAPPGERPTPLCLVARDLLSSRLVRTWFEPGIPTCPPFDFSPDNLFVAYYGSAELGCFLALGWPFPVRILDLYAEFRCLTSGLPVPCGHGLLGALAYYGLDGLALTEKDSMRQLAMRGGPYTEQEQQALLEYCQTDVDALTQLLPKMVPQLDLPRALLRGRYTAAAARIEWTGIPIDVATLSRLRKHWERIRTRLTSAIDRDYGVYLPVGQRVLDPETRLGAAIFQTAAAWRLNPYDLAVAVEQVWTETRELYAESIAARRAARQATGLTTARIDRWETAGHDYSAWPGLDDVAQELAGELPELGLGPGYQDDSKYDEIDYAGRLWTLLRDHDERLPQRHDPEILRRAADLVTMNPDDEWRYRGPLAFSTHCFERYLASQGLPWPRLDSGALALDDDTFREMARAYPAKLGPLRELRHALGQLRLTRLTVGSDGRNRCLLSMFGSRSGRNQPSNSKYIFGPSTWLRSLIQPRPGHALAYVDWSQQELGIAAALSGDLAMQEAYRSGDFYLAFAKMAGAVPAEATKETHGETRNLFKTAALGVLYGLSEHGLARRLALPLCEARALLRRHREVFRQFWHCPTRWRSPACSADSSIPCMGGVSTLARQ